MRFLSTFAVMIAVSCGGSQHPSSPTWDTQALAAVHGAAHALVLADDGAAAFYQARTDHIAATGGPDGGSLIGSDYVAATALLDAQFRTLAYDLGATREALLLAEAVIRQAAAVADAPSRCRAAIALDAAAVDVDRVAADATTLGFSVDPSIVASVRVLEAVIVDLSASCTDAGQLIVGGTP